ncbi:molybdenum cofactor guanylyltransferase MobA [Marinobacter sp. HN1S83]|uniref:molybdenum cofactor guanylyltransferase MobA n=1 Tax=Marinobacter sp. HN1S83 TaxID=3382301 RepID=UPI00387AE301
MTMKKQTDQKHIAGLLLAGGEGRRLGGRDKGMVFWQGRPMAAWVHSTLSTVASPVLISANRSLDDYRQLAPNQVVEDEEAVRGQGPLAGLLTGMKQAAALGADAVLVCPCDTPEITPDVLSHLVSAWRKAPDNPVIAECEGRAHPLHGVYPVSLVPLLEKQLHGEGNRRVMVFAEAAGVVKVKCESAAEAFKNRNRPEDLEDNSEAGR